MQGPLYVSDGESRTKAQLLDMVITLPIFLFISYRMTEWIAQHVPSVHSYIMIIMYIFTAIMFVYQILFTWILGATMGKLFLGIRVVDAADPNKKVTLRQAIIRVVSNNIIGGLTLFGPGVFMVWRKDRRQIADLLAKTQILQKTKPREELKRRPFLAVIFLTAAVFMGIISLRGWKQMDHFTKTMVQMDEHAMALSWGVQGGGSN